MGQSRPESLKTVAGTCPICTAPTEHEYRPFCSRRCADVDLSRWLRGSYAIPVLEDEDEDGTRAPATTGDGPEAAMARSEGEGGD